MTRLMNLRLIGFLLVVVAPLTLLLSFLTIEAQRSRARTKIVEELRIGSSLDQCAAMLSVSPSKLQSRAERSGYVWSV